MDPITVHCWECEDVFETSSAVVALLTLTGRPHLVLCERCREKKIGPIKEHSQSLELVVAHLVWLELLSLGMDKDTLVTLGTEMCAFVKSKYPDPRAHALHLALRLTFKDGIRGLPNKYLFTRKLFVDKTL